MFVIGIVGGIASGKSAVASLFESLGAEVIDADRLGHQVLDDPEVIAAAVERWGPEVLEKGRLCRQWIAKRVFSGSDSQRGSDAERDFWQSCTHRRIERLAGERIAEISARNPPPAGVVLDAALLFEAGWARICSKIVFLEVPREIRLQRARLRGWSEAEFAAREAAQMPVDEKREKADFVIDNSVALEETYRRVKEIWIHLSS